MLWLVQSNQQYVIYYRTDEASSIFPFRNRTLHRTGLANGKSHAGRLCIDRAHRSAAVPWQMYIGYHLPLLFTWQGDDATDYDDMSTRRKQCDHYFHTANVLCEDRVVRLSRMSEARLRERCMRRLFLNMIYSLWLKSFLKFYSSSEISLANGFESETTFSLNEMKS